MVVTPQIEAHSTSRMESANSHARTEVSVMMRTIALSMAFRTSPCPAALAVGYKLDDTYPDILNPTSR